jgi:methylated-DNA-[protein]-cysteine S-methyltransferase
MTVKMKCAFIYETPFARIGIAEENEAITNIFFGTSIAPKEYETLETPLIRKARRQLQEYFAGKRTAFDPPLATCGDEIQEISPETRRLSRLILRWR